MTLKRILPAMAALGLSAPAATPQDSTRVSPDSAAVLPDSSEMNVFRSAIAGVEIRKPASWYFADLQSVLEHRASANLSDEDLDRFLKEHASAPLVAAMKHEEPCEALNPSFQVIARPAGALEGKPAARLSATYVVTTGDGREFPTRSTLVVVPRGKVLYQIGFSGPPEGPDRLRSEIEEILGSVKFLN